MEQIIQALISIEENYNLTMEKIEQDKKKLPRLIEEKINQGTKMIKLREREKIEYINKKLDIETKQKIEVIYKELEEKKLILEKEYKSNRPIWEKEVVVNILGFGGEF